jgi:hypothetical protein
MKFNTAVSIFLLFIKVNDAPFYVEHQYLPMLLPRLKNLLSWQNLQVKNLVLVLWLHLLQEQHQNTICVQLHGL